MQRQFRVTHALGCTLVNVDVRGSPVPKACYSDAAEQAGFILRTNCRVTLVPLGYELGLPFDQVPVMLPAYPLPNESYKRCEYCLSLFGTTNGHAVFCSFECKQHAQRARELRLRAMLGDLRAEMRLSDLPSTRQWVRPYLSAP